jgi:heme/copper-type cytochrome/quinol oxidase subunit 1
MRLNAPKQIVWLIALILGVLGIISALITVPFLSTISFWLVVIGWLLLILATYLKGM